MRLIQRFMLCKSLLWLLVKPVADVETYSSSA
jgi:hypothetical protein